MFDIGVIFKGEGGHLQQKFELNVGDERKRVQAVITDMYKFHRVDGMVSG